MLDKTYCGLSSTNCLLKFVTGVWRHGLFSKICLHVQNEKITVFTLVCDLGCVRGQLYIGQKQRN